eukprot:4026672-Karenia_brevis.AAC.1
MYDLHLARCAPSQEQWLEPGCHLESDDPYAVVATFLRSIPRKKPPIKPVGLECCDEACVERWTSDQFRYPPYYYKINNMVQEPGGTWRMVNVREKERALMYPAGITDYMFTAKQKGPHNCDEQNSAL